MAEKKDEKKDEAKKADTTKPADLPGTPPFDTIPPEIKNAAPPPVPSNGKQAEKAENAPEKKPD